MLRQSLGALLASDLPRDRWELIVVDDGSADDSSFVAAEFADVVVRLVGRPRGPAYARNRGFEVAHGDLVVFVDADVCVHPDTLRRFAARFVADPGLGAAFGSYDARPSAVGTVSKYRNLLHHYVHQRHAGAAETFWAGCGAIRSSAFVAVGMFDEWHYSRPQIEDIELGRRLRRAGYRILLDPSIQGTHLKQWTLRNVLRTDLRARGVPWIWLILEEGPSAGSSVLNVGAKEKVCTGLTGLTLVAIAAAAILGQALLLVGAVAAVAAILTLNRNLYHFFALQGGVRFVAAAFFLHFLYYLVSGTSVVLGWVMHTVFGEPPVPPEVSAQEEVGIRTWPPGPVRPSSSIWSPVPADVGESLGVQAVPPVRVQHRGTS